jgi:hypothetical protein
VPARTSDTHLWIASGGIRSAPQPPSPPALATAIASEAGQALAIGAIKIGTRSRPSAVSLNALVNSSRAPADDPTLTDRISL